MRSAKLFGLMVAAVALGVPAAAHAEDGIYVGAAGGVNFQRPAHVNTGTTTNRINTDAGYATSGSIGYAFGSGFRTEAEFSFRSSEVDNVKGSFGGPTYRGTIDNYGAMANLFYDVDLTGLGVSSSIRPYVGFGVGASFVDFDKVGALKSGDYLKGQDTRVAYQGILGASYALTNTVALTADYRYFGTDRDSIKFENAGSKATVSNGNHTIMVGVRYAFGNLFEAKSAETVLPAPVAQPSQAAVPAVPKTYMVFFDFNKSNLTTEAKQVLASVAKEIQSGKYVRIQVTGNTDTVGSEKYNQKLSERRAAAVRKELVRLGVPAGEIVARGAGESQLRVPTADGVREAQNRRAEIVLLSPSDVKAPAKAAKKHGKKAHKAAHKAAKKPVAKQ